MDKNPQRSVQKENDGPLVASIRKSKVSKDEVDLAMAKIRQNLDRDPNNAPLAIVKYFSLPKTERFQALINNGISAEVARKIAGNVELEEQMFKQVNTEMELDAKQAVKRRREEHAA